MYTEPKRAPINTINKKTLLLGGVFLLLIGALVFVVQQVNAPIKPLDDGQLTITRYTPTPGTSTDTASSLEDDAVARIKRERPLGLPCLKNIKKYCILRYDDVFFQALGIDPTKTKFNLNGEQISPSYIYFQIAFENYTEEAITDQSGKIITATKKEYDKPSKTLTIYIGVQEDYFRLIPEDQRKNLYLAQLVRTFSTMMGNTSSDFNKTFSVTDKLASWKPEI